MYLIHPEGFLEARELHYQRFFGPLTEAVMHSTDLKAIHVDVYQFAPTPKRPFWTLVTSGMSNERQIEPGNAPDYVAPRAEILMYARQPQEWMFSVLKGLAEMPFDDDTCIHWWHTVPNGMPMTAKPSLLTSFFFLPPYYETQEFNELTVASDKVDFLWMVPITEAERSFAVEHGSNALEQRLMDSQISPVVDEARLSVV